MIQITCVLSLLLSFHGSAEAKDSVQTLPMWKDRPYLLHLPPETGNPLPVLLAFHGGGGNAELMARMTCPGGDTASPYCLNALADRKGFVVVYPNGTFNPAACSQDPRFCRVRTFNAGGGKRGFNCTSKYACETGVDDLSYVRDLLKDLGNQAAFDPARVYAIGMSNGGAMAHRLACQMSGQIAAIASVAAANQFSSSEPCSPGRAVPILEIHGLEDPVWPYEGGLSSLPGVEGEMFSERTSVENWVSRDGCTPGAGSLTWLPDLFPWDGTRVGMFANSRCRHGSEVIHYFVQGGGHTWPSGWDYSPTTSGRVSYELDANETIWKFLRNHSLR